MRAVELKKLVPWWVKIAAKLALARAPAGYHFWYRMNLFAHGDMVTPAYALHVVRWHLEHVGWSDLAGRTVLELGPGDSVATAVIARTLGARETILADAGAFASPEVSRYVGLTKYLRAQGMDPPDLGACTSVDQVLACCDARYFTDGLQGLQQIRSHTVDLFFSHAVLEHVRKKHITATFNEMLRVLKPCGIGSHRVDLTDHLGGGLNNLRFSEDVWEAEWMAKSGFYTNRLRFSALYDHLTRTGFLVEVTREDMFPGLPLSRASMSPEFSGLAEEDLLVRGFDILLRPASCHSSEDMPRLAPSK